MHKQEQDDEHDSTRLNHALGFAGLRAFPQYVQPPLYHRERCVTSVRGGVVELHRRAKMSLTIMTEIMISRTVVMMLRTRERAASYGVARLSGMTVRFRPRGALDAVPSSRELPSL
jgi:hypothetical protein